MSEQRRLRPAHYQIGERMKQHKELMDKFIAEGMEREAASWKAYRIVTGKETE